MSKKRRTARSVIRFAIFFTLRVWPILPGDQNEAFAQPPTSNASLQSAFAVEGCVAAISERDAWLAAITAAAEARGEPDPDTAMTLVLEVIANRVCSGNRGDETVERAVLRSKQFSAWNPDSPMRDDLDRLARGEHISKGDLEVAALRILPTARLVLKGHRTGLISVSILHYVALEQSKPVWALKGRAVLKHGAHTFLELP